MKISENMLLKFPKVVFSSLLLLLIKPVNNFFMLDKFQHQLTLQQRIDYTRNALKRAQIRFLELKFTNPSSWKTKTYKQEIKLLACKLERLQAQLEQNKTIFAK